MFRSNRFCKSDSLRDDLKPKASLDTLSEFAVALIASASASSSPAPVVPEVVSLVIEVVAVVVKEEVGIAIVAAGEVVELLVVVVVEVDNIQSKLVVSHTAADAAITDEETCSKLLELDELQEMMLDAVEGVELSIEGIIAVDSVRVAVIRPSLTRIAYRARAFALFRGPLAPF